MNNETMTKEERNKKYIERLAFESSTERYRKIASNRKLKCKLCGKPMDSKVQCDPDEIKKNGRKELERIRLERQNMTDEEKKEQKMKAFIWENSNEHIKAVYKQRKKFYCSECIKKREESSKAETPFMKKSTVNGRKIVKTKRQ